MTLLKVGSFLMFIIEHSDSRLIYYTSGYIVRKFFKVIKCQECRLQLSSQKDEVDVKESYYTKEFDLGGLMYPSKQLYDFISLLENNFTESVSVSNIHRDLTFDVIQSLHKTNISFIGCRQHKHELTKRLVRFYILTRMHFYLKSTNKFVEQRRKRMKLLKLRRTV